MQHQLDFNTLQEKIRIEYYINNAAAQQNVANILRIAAMFPSGIRTLSHLSSILKVLSNEGKVYITELFQTVYAFDPNSRTVVSYHSDDKWYESMFNFSLEVVTNLFVESYRYETDVFKMLQILQQLQHINHAKFSELYHRFLLDNPTLFKCRETVKYCTSGHRYMFTIDKIHFKSRKEFSLHLNKPFEINASSTYTELDMAIETLDFHILQNFFSA